MMCYEEWQHILSGSGRVGFTINVPNLVAGVLIATGQDVAAVESYNARLSMSSLSSEEIVSIGNYFVVKWVHY